jgi:hypothetical protein
MIFVHTYKEIYWFVMYVNDRQQPPMRALPARLPQLLPARLLPIAPMILL